MDKNKTGLFELVEGLEPVDASALAEYEREMTDEAIPAGNDQRGRETPDARRREPSSTERMRNGTGRTEEEEKTMNDGVGNSWRVDSTAFDKLQKEEKLGLCGCPQCYSKTYVKYKVGETCPNCGSIIGVYFFFQSKQDDSKWIRCTSEKTCMKMAKQGYVVKKIVQPSYVKQ